MSTVKVYLNGGRGTGGYNHDFLVGLVIRNTDVM